MNRNLLLGFFAMALGIQAQTPVVSSVTNGASYSPLVSPGAFVAIFGANFGGTMADTSVAVSGLNAPVYFVSSSQINVQFPSGLRLGPATLTVTVRGVVSAPVHLNISAYAPALLTANASGTGIGVFTSAEEPSTPVSAATPGQAVAAYAIGLGAANADSPRVTVGGVDAAVSFAGLAPGQTAVYKVVFLVPPVGPGNRDVSISIGGVTSPAVTLPIAPRPATHGQRLNPAPGRILRSPVTLRSEATPAASGVTYTCNSNISTTICNTLNSTIAGLYSSAFTNAGASIYIEFGSTGLGQSLTAINDLSYTSFRNALIANETDAADVTAVANSVPATNPYGSDSVSLPNATMRALGFSAGFGVTTSAKSCSLGATGCYDGMITISSAENTAGNLYFRTGPPITGNQYDFYTTVEHETDEVLATASCLLECSGAVSPPDLYRYHSDGTRSFAAGNNNSCSSSNTANACFSIDGVAMLQQYNNLDNGDDFGDWVSNCNTPLVQDAVGCPGVANVDISPSAEILVLDVVGFSLTGATGVPDLTITKTHSGSFTQGQTADSYTITVTNSGTASTSGAVTVTEIVPTGLTATSMTGGGWGCTQPAGPCTRSDVLTPGNSYPAITLMVNVAGNAPASVTNQATVAGGGEFNTGNDTATDPTTILSASLPDLTIAKTHNGNFTQGQTGVSYNITATNSGTGPTVGAVTVTDTLPTGLTATSITGIGWGCTQPAGPCTRSDVLAAGNSYAAITLTVNVAGNAPASVTNQVTVSGGGESNTGNDAAGDLTTILPATPDLTISKTHTGNFSQGQTGAKYTITAANSGTGPTVGTVTVADTLPTGLTATSITGTGWGCTQPAGPCTRGDALAAGSSYAAITLTVNVAANAPASVTNQATVSGGGEFNTGNDTATDVTTIVVSPPDLTISKTHMGNFTQGQTGATYTITAANSGTGPTVGTVTVTDTLPTGLTATSIMGTGWGCTQPAGPCTRGDALAAGSSYAAITLTVNVAGNAPASVTNQATVSGGGESNTGNDTASDVTTIVPAPPDLTIAKTHLGNFTQGQTGAKYTITAANSGTGPTVGTVTVADTLPMGLTATSIAGTGWGCTQPAGPCTRSDVLAAGSSYAAITLTVNVASSAPAGVTNQVTVSGGGEANTGNDTASDVTTILAAPPDLTISKTHAGNFTQGQTGATYTITAANSGTGPTVGTVTVTDTLPTGLTATSIAGTGWGCTQPAGPCTRSDVLAAGSSYAAITLTVNVAINAPASVTNQATVSGGGESNTGNDTATDATTILAAPPDLTISKTHAGNFTQGQTGDTYTITVANSGAGPTTGTVTVSDALPAGLTATSIAGTGWGCTQPAGPCTRSDVLAAGGSYGAITLTVNVAGNAPASVTNQATVSGGGESNTGNDTAADATTILPATPGLTISKTHAGNFTQGQAGATYTITVTNSGKGPTSGTVTVTETPPSGLTLVSISGTGSGSGWNCAAGSCTRSDSLAAGSSYPTIIATVNVAANASSPQVNSVSLSGGGSANSNASDSTTIIANPPVLSIAKTHSGSFTQGQINAPYALSVSNQAGAGPTSGLVTVTEIPPSGLTLTSMTGTGWSCMSTTCTRSDVLNGGSTYPAITATVNVALTASSPQVNQASVSGGGTALVQTIADSTVIAPGASGTLTATPSSGSTFTYILGTTPPSLPLDIASNPSAVAFSVAPSANLGSSEMNGATPNTATISINPAAVTTAGTQSGTVTVSALNSALNCASPVMIAGQSVCTAAAPFTINVQPAFFQGETSVGDGFFNLTFFGTYDFASYNPLTIYHITLGFEGIFTNTDASRGIYFFDYASGHIWYTSPALFPNIYDFNENAWLFYFGGNAMKGGRSFYNFGGPTTAAGFIFL